MEDNNQQNKITEQIITIGMVVGMICIGALIGWVAAKKPTITYHHKPTRTTVKKPPTPSSPSRPAKLSQPILFAFVGDVLMDGVENPFRYVSSALKSADVAFCNLECPISESGEPTPDKLENGKIIPGEFLFRAKPRAVQSLVNGGIDIVSLANNHTMDYGSTALIDTMNALKLHGIAYAGAGHDETQARRPTVITRKGTHIAFLAYVLADTLPSTTYTAAGPGNPGVAVLDSSDIGTSRQKIKQDVNTACGSADLVVVSYHWGVERTIHPTAQQKLLARCAIDCGADIVVGHHPHVLQGVEVYRGKPILYSLGNFVFPNKKPPVRRTGIAWVRISPDKSAKVTFQPLYIQNRRPIGGRTPDVSAAASQMFYCTRILGSSAEIIWRDGTPYVSVPVQDVPTTTRRLDDNPWDFVDVQQAVPGIRTDIRYASKSNRYKMVFYETTRCFIRKGTARRLAAVQADLAKLGMGLKIWDGYRPLSAHNSMCAMSHNSRYLANPATGSAHSRGAAVDLTLVDSNGREIPMPTDFDDFSPLASGKSHMTSPTRRHNAKLLRQTMEAHGFKGISLEWWHFEDVDAAQYPFADITTGELALRIPATAEQLEREARR